MKPLTGLKVLDFSHVIAGPLATFYLAQLGADVTKVEKPGGGDVLRGSGPASAMGAAQFIAFNAGKRSVSIDLKSPQGRAEALELARHCDVLLDNFRPGALKRAGLGLEAVRGINPSVIYCSVSGYGTQYAPWRARGAYDHIIQAATGMAMLGGEAGGAPVKVGFPVVDVMSGVLAAFAVTAAVQERTRTGEGRHVDVSMWGAALQLMYPQAVATLASGQSPERVGNKGFSGSPAAEYFEAAPDANGRPGHIAIGANTAAQIAKLYALLGWDAAQADLDLERGHGFARAKNPSEFRARLATALLTRSAQDWEDRLQAAGVPAARLRNLDEFMQEAQFAGALVPTQLRHDGMQVATPGLGWTCS
jgi:crotonobetainyl-CoA:carnitine CoA-transferase CaiB-like acyl-CoA transferase